MVFVVGIVFSATEPLSVRDGFRLYAALSYPCLTESCSNAVARRSPFHAESYCDIPSEPEYLQLEFQKQ
eukprot:4854276-Amphidinium_carterae.1